MKEKVLVLATAVAIVKEPNTPAERVRCHCPQDCWANKQTLKLVEKDGYEPDFYCLKCAPEPVRSSAAFILTHRAELGIDADTPLRVDIGEVQPSPSPHGGSLN